MDVPILGSGSSGVSSSLKTGEEIGPQIRLLVCRTCKVIEELPDYEGNPDHDVTLQVMCERHTDSMGTAHVGNLIKVPIKYWARSEVQKEIRRQISEGSGGLNEMDQQFYDSRSTFHEDAMSCFRKHNRPAGRCPDWKASSKRLVPKTAADRKEAGLAKPGEAGPKVYLCDFCPAKTYMLTKFREETGAYK